MNKKQSISRRTAIKRMGGALLSVSLIGAVPFSVNSCRKKTRRIVFYFTGTGNSLYVARQLATEGTFPLSIAQEVHNADPVYEADEIGFVFPVYFFKAPAIVHEFVERSTFRADYFFTVATYGAMQGGIVEFWDNYTQSLGMPFDYISTLLMRDNYLPFFDMEEQAGVQKNIPENLQRIVEEVNSRTRYKGPLSGGSFPGGQAEEKNVTFRAEDIFAVTDACIGCSICTRVCPHKSWSVFGQASPGGECERCMACAQNCPQKAITIKTGERNPNARFRNEHITLSDIINANEQHAK